MPGRALRVPLVRTAQNRHERGRAAIGEPHLLSREDVVVAVPHALGRDRRHIRTQRRLGHREGAADFPRRHLRQEIVPLLLGAVLLEQVGDDEVGVHDPRDAHPAAGDLLHAERVREKGLTEPAVLLRNHQAEQPQFREPLDDPRRIFVAVLQLGRHRQDLFVDEVTDGGEDFPLDIGEGFGLREASHGYFSTFFAGAVRGSGRPGCSPPRSLT